MTETRTGRGRPPGSTGSELLAIARSVFLDKGYAGTTMEDVAARARVSKASLYREHASKAALYAAVVADWSDAGRHAMRPAFDRLRGADDLATGLRELAATVRAGVLSDDVLAMRRLVTSTADAHPEVAARYLAESWQRNIDDLAGAFRDLDAAGRLSIADPRRAAEEFIWLTVGAALNAALLSGSVPRPGGAVDSAVETFSARYARES
jgi:AcrR family transcriptional regulator